MVGTEVNTKAHYTFSSFSQKNNFIEDDEEINLENKIELSDISNKWYKTSRISINIENGFEKEKKPVFTIENNIEIFLDEEEDEQIDEKNKEEETKIKEKKTKQKNKNHVLNLKKKSVKNKVSRFSNTKKIVLKTEKKNQNVQKKTLEIKKKI